MELYLQFGYGMMDHCRALTTNWGGATTILSPRDLKPEQLARIASDINSIRNGYVLLDPQFYLPRADHARLCSHDYWPSNFQSGVFWQGPALTQLLRELRTLNLQLACRGMILPGILASSVDDDWLGTQEAILGLASTEENTLPLYVTIALSDEAVQSQDQIELLLERSEHWHPHGYYIVCQHPNGQYLVDNPNWLVNVLDLVAGLKLRGAHVILGYCNHQMLIASAVKADAIASGTWMNVRSFPPEKFNMVYEEEIKQRAIWYYCPSSLSEYKIPFLDIAYRSGLLNSLAPSAELDGGFAAPLFSGAQPTSVNLTEPNAFRHYLHCLRIQTAFSVAASYDNTVSGHNTLLNNAETLARTLSSAGVLGQLRDFRPIIDVNRSALNVLNATRGALLRRMWSTL